MWVIKYTKAVERSLKDQTPSFILWPFTLYCLFPSIHGHVVIVTSNMCFQLDDRWLWGNCSRQTGRNPSLLFPLTGGIVSLYLVKDLSWTVNSYSFITMFSKSYNEQAQSIIIVSLQTCCDPFFTRNFAHVWCMFMSVVLTVVYGNHWKRKLVHSTLTNLKCCRYNLSTYRIMEPICELF
jgi:hypothetical protein